MLMAENMLTIATCFLGYFFTMLASKSDAERRLMMIRAVIIDILVDDSNFCWDNQTGKKGTNRNKLKLDKHRAM